jgi:hypothetical protein
MRRLLMLCAVLLALVPSAALAQACRADAFWQADMAGVYVDPASPMRVELYPCGGAYVQWDNAYGTHSAAYGSTQRLPGGGVMAVALPVTGVPLDDSRQIGFKPAEPGYIQVITLGVYDDTYRVYRLRKIA